jgi:hypothetical protein
MEAFEQRLLRIASFLAVSIGQIMAFDSLAYCEHGAYTVRYTSGLPVSWSPPAHG